MEQRKRELRHSRDNDRGFRGRDRGGDDERAGRLRGSKKGRSGRNQVRSSLSEIDFTGNASEDA